MSRRPLPWAEARSVLRLAAPIALTQIGMVLYGTVDMLFVGRLGPGAIAAVGLGSITYFTGFTIGMGVVMGLDPFASRAHGAGRREEAGQWFVHAAALALAIGVPLFFLYGLAGEIYRLIGVAPEVAEGAARYLTVLRWCVFPGLLYIACRQFLQSISVTTPMVVAIALGNATNALLDLSFVFGRFGAPRLGVVGSAWATLCSNFVMLFVAAAAVESRLRRDAYRFDGWRPHMFEGIARKGLPGGLQMLAEVAIFSLVTALVGRLGALPLAAHQITLNLASMTFMVPMGVAHAAAARVGQALGRGDSAAAAASGRAAALISVAFMAATGVSFAAAPGFFVRLYGAGAEVAAIAVPLLYCSAAFQVFDGAQVTLTGALRGLGETRRPLVFNLIGHWLVGLPLGAWLCFRRGWGATGLWIGLTAGLVVVALLLWFEWDRATAEGAAPVAGL